MKNSVNVLFKTINIGKQAVHNRIAVAPMVTNFANTDGSVSDAIVEYYCVRARGGAGLVIVEATSVALDVKISFPMLEIFEDRFISGLTRISSAIKEEGSVAFIQLCHGGPKSYPKINRGRKPVSCSNVPVCPGEENIPRELSNKEINDVVNSFVEAANRAVEAGFQGIELHAAHFYLLSAFLSPHTNNRQNQWGGSTEGRARLVCKIITEIKKKVGSDIPIICRFNGAENVPNGLTLEEACKLAVMFERAGADALHVSALTAPIPTNVRNIRRTMFEFGAVPLADAEPGIFLPFAEGIKRVATVPVIGVGKLSEPSVAVQAVVDGKCDIVALGRQMLIDPYWPKKIQAGEFNKLKLCSYCMICHTMQQKFQPVICSENKNLIGEPVYLILP